MEIKAVEMKKLLNDEYKLGCVLDRNNNIIGAVFNSFLYEFLNLNMVDNATKCMLKYS